MSISTVVCFDIGEVNTGFPIEFGFGGGSAEGAWRWDVGVQRWGIEESVGAEGGDWVYGGGSRGVKAYWDCDAQSEEGMIEEVGGGDGGIWVDDVVASHIASPY